MSGSFFIIGDHILANEVVAVYVYLFIASGTIHLPTTILIYIVYHYTQIVIRPIGNPMLTSKLLRIETTLVERIEKLATKLSETEYTSFSALARKLIRKGFEYIDLDGKDKTVRYIPKVHFSKLRGGDNPKTYNDTEIENVMSAFDAFHGMERDYDMDGGHIMIHWRAMDARGEHFGNGTIPLNDLKLGDEIYIGLPNLHKLVVMGKEETDEEVSG